MELFQYLSLLISRNTCKNAIFRNEGGEEDLSVLGALQFAFYCQARTRNGFWKYEKEQDFFFKQCAVLTFVMRIQSVSTARSFMPVPWLISNSRTGSENRQRASL